MKLADIAPVQRVAQPRAWISGVGAFLMLSAFAGIAFLIINAIGGKIPQARQLFWTPGAAAPAAPAAPVGPVLRTYGVN